LEFKVFAPQGFFPSLEGGALSLELIGLRL